MNLIITGSTTIYHLPSTIYHLPSTLYHLPSLIPHPSSLILLRNNNGAKLRAVTNKITQCVIADITKHFCGSGKRITNRSIRILPSSPKIKTRFVNIADLKIDSIASMKKIGFLVIKISIDAWLHQYFIGSSINEQVIKNRI